MLTNIESFLCHMHLSGLETNDLIIADGRLHRFHVLGDRRGSQNGWYILYPDFPLIGIFGCWKRHLRRIWSPSRGNLNIADLRVLNERKRSIHARSTQEFQNEHDAQREWAEIWQNATPASNRHGYLVSKNVRSHGLRYHQGALLVPVMDIDGKFQGTQRIWPKGEKRFTKGTITSGHFFIVGEHISATLLICEGYAGISILYNKEYPFQERPV
jgi:putative DNA primase/helicase